VADGSDTTTTHYITTIRSLFRKTPPLKSSSSIIVDSNLCALRTIQ